MRGTHWRGWCLGAVTVAGVVAACWLPPLPQDPAYHTFADRRTVFGIPHFWNVSTNLAFVLVGAWGLRRYARLHPAACHAAYLVFCLGVVGVGVGSAAYHSAPSTPALVWDRIPMTVAFMALFAMVVRDRLSEHGGRVLLWPLILAGVASVGYWYWSELHGRGDLRPYGVIQFLPMLLLPLMLILYHGNTLRTRWLWGTVGTYAVAKVAEHYDDGLYAMTGIVSGHSLKHIVGALAALWAVVAVRRWGG
jgi:hypothetical protein